VSGTQPLAQRFVIAQSWWVASELIRRHPELHLIETHPGGGQYDCLSLLTGPGDNPTTLIGLNRHGRMHVLQASGFEPIGWETLLRERDPHASIKRLETAAGLSHPSPAPPSSPAALTFRVIARVLASLVDVKQPWDARNEQLDSSGGDGGPRGYLQDFPRAAELAQVRRPDDVCQTPGYRFWALLQAEHPVAILDTDGHVHLRGEQHDLPDLYVRSGRSLSTIIHLALGDVLP
jgi:hypothetical protein